MSFQIKLRDLGEKILEKIGYQDESLIYWKNWLQNYEFLAQYPDDSYTWFTNVLALKSVDSGNYGVGSIIIDPKDKLVAMGHNLVYSPSFRSDLHAEMVVLNSFEETNPQITSLKDYTLYTSLESCPMCLARLISSGMNKVVYTSHDPIGGMTEKISLFPSLWKDLSKSQVFTKAMCSPELSKASTEIMLINAAELLEILKKRRE